MTKEGQKSHGTFECRESRTNNEGQKSHGTFECRKSHTNNEGQKSKSPKTVIPHVSEADPFIGELMGFSCQSDIGKMLITEFDEKWVDDAICKLLDKVHGHIFGVVM